jgi:anti-sigma28 factor (negative regulator of flagellin synthesis)
MTRNKTLSAIIFTVIFFVASGRVFATGQTTKTASEQSRNEKSKTTDDHQSSGKHTASNDDAHSKAPHGKAHAPHSEELPHIHRFHKERVKKIKKHHGKCWFLSQVLLFICHAAILYISYLHAAS